MLCPLLPLSSPRRVFVSLARFFYASNQPARRADLFSAAFSASIARSAAPVDCGFSFLVPWSNAWEASTKIADASAFESINVIVSRFLVFDRYEAMFFPFSTSPAANGPVVFNSECAVDHVGEHKRPYDSGSEYNHRHGAAGGVRHNPPRVSQAMPFGLSGA